jgi:hypothetical protein
MVVLPSDRDLDKITFVTSDLRWPNRIILCQGCNGIILFNIDELNARRASGQSTSTPCRYCSYHPGWPPEPHIKYDFAGGDHLAKEAA